MSVFEIGMLVCFGFAWPISIYKSLTSRSIEGKSLLFMYVIITGYIFGIFHKIFFHPDFVIVLYAINMAMVCFDLSLYYINKRRIKINQATNEM